MMFCRPYFLFSGSEKDRREVYSQKRQCGVPAVGIFHAAAAGVEAGEPESILRSDNGRAVGGGWLPMLFRHNVSLGGINVLVLYVQERYGWRAGLVQLGPHVVILLLSIPNLDNRRRHILTRRGGVEPDSGHQSLAGTVHGDLVTKRFKSFHLFCANAFSMSATIFLSSGVTRLE